MHTPGPWICEQYHVGIPYEKDSLYMVNVAKYHGQSEAYANARLIAAAPTMYDYIKSRAADGDEQAAQLLKAIHE